VKMIRSAFDDFVNFGKPTIEDRTIKLKISEKFYCSYFRSEFIENHVID
jgi:hypothetical protein